MLVTEKKQRPWIALTLIVVLTSGILYALVHRSRSDGFTAGSTVGLYFGAAGFLLMVFAAMLWVNRLFKKRWLLVPRRIWMRGHLWLGLLSAWFVLLHCGGRMGGKLEQIVYVLTIVTALTGIYGLLLQQFVPRLLNVQIDRELPQLQVDHVRMDLLRQSNKLVESICGSGLLESEMMRWRENRDGAGQLENTDDPKSHFARFYVAELRPFLNTPDPRSLRLNDRLISKQIFGQVRAFDLSAADVQCVDQIEDICERRRQLALQTRLHWHLHSWLVLHVPFSFALIALSCVHAVMSVYY
ncbi:MAG: hypothetical protein KDB27_16100 [Planctomycetales bacterium]|nr:hypothetical protein [Planctomycetales bacterium]